MTKYRKSWTETIKEVILNEALKPLDKSVVDAFYYKKEKAGKVVSTDGDSLWKNGLGGQEIAIWMGRKIHISAVSDVKSTEAILKYMKKSIPAGVFEEVEVEEAVNLKKLKKEYDDNEDKNNHTENYLLLAKAFGSSSEVKKVQEIMKKNEKQGHTSKSDMDWMYKNINPYYDKIRNEEVEIEEKFAGWIAFYNNDKLEIKPKKGVIDSLYDAKQAAIKHFKVPKSKQGLLAIEPAHEEVVVEDETYLKGKAATGYDLYHKDFSAAMQHAYKHAKSKGFVIDPKEIDDKVATGPKKPSSGKTNRYALKAGRKTVHIQVANLDNKRYELNMYIEDYDKNQLLRVKHDEALIAEAGDICALNRGVLRSKSMQAVWEKKCAPKLDNQTLGEKDMEKLVDTVRRVLVGEDSDKDDPGTQGDKAEYQKKRKEVAKKFGVESCSALKDEAKRKECYNALDKAHVADHEEQVFLHNMNKKEESKKKVTESTGLQMKMAFDDANIKVKGTKGGKLVIDRNDQKKVTDVLSKSLKRGTNVSKAIDKFIKFEEVEDQVDPNPSKTVSKLFSHVRKLMSK